MFSGMKSYPVELRERIVGFVGEGGSKVDAARHFKVSRQTVYRYLAAEQGGSLAPKPQGGSQKKFTDKKLLKAVAKKPDATLKEHAEKLGVSHVAVWRRLRQLSVTLKKSPALRRAGRGAEGMLPAGSGRAAGQRPGGVFP